MVPGQMWSHTVEVQLFLSLFLFIGNTVIPQNISWEIAGSSLIITWSLPSQLNKHISHYVLKLSDKDSEETSQFILLTPLASLDNLALNSVYVVRIAVFTDYLNPFSDDVTMSIQLTGTHGVFNCLFLMFNSTNSVSY